MKLSRIFEIVFILGGLSLAQKTLFKGEDIGISLNEPMEKMDKYASNFDKLTLLFLFDSEKNKS